MDKKTQILVTGGAGFIGSFLVDELVKKGYGVRIYDNLERQVHGGRKPKYLNPQAEFVRGDVNDYKALTESLSGCDFVFHLASSVGVGQSQYQIKKYTHTNLGGTATLLDIIVNENIPVKKIIFPSSMTIYGEGLYKCSRHGNVRPGIRPYGQMQKKNWEPKCPDCGRTLKTIPITEESLSIPSSVYAFTKQAAENLLMTVGKVYNIPVTIFRLFNVYGPRQSLSNPYTGVTAIYLSRLKNGHPPIVYEDGLQSRDFISVHDVVEVLMSAMKKKSSDYETFNVGSGRGTSIKDIAFLLQRLLSSSIIPQITARGRKNDIRHCTANIMKAWDKLGWKPKVSLAAGLKELMEWSREEPSFDFFAKASEELAAKKIIK